MRIRPFKATFPNFDFIASPDTFCENAKFSFEEFRKNGFFEQSTKDAFYIYQIQTMSRKHTGLITLNDVHDFFDGKIKKHEKTLSEKEQQQMEFFMRWNAILKPVLLTYDPIAGINSYLETYAQNNKPLIETKFEKDGQIHRVWEVSEEHEVQHLTSLFAEKVNSTYIADGHHRTTTVALLYERLKDKNPDLDFDNLFCAFFSADQLDILDYNRVVEGLKEVSITHLMVKLSKLFDLEVLPKATKPSQKHEMILYIRKEWFRLRWKPEVLKQQNKSKILLDASMLNELVFRDIFGIEDVRNDTRITYIEGAKGLEGVRKASNDNNDRMGFALFPVSFSDLMRMVDAGESLPPKSTYFEPRLRSGLLVKLLKYAEN
jgi:uncharacterized protein (DUF1015 family)